MKRYALLLLIAAAGCSPQYTSGKTQCSTSKQCPSGFSCKDDGTSATHYCFDNKTLGCPESSGFYCSQSSPPTCWPKPGACATVTFCGTAKHPGNVICASLNYHPDCNGDQCLPNSAVPDAGSGLGGMLGVGGITGKGGTGGGTIIGVGGVTGRDGAAGTTVIGYGGTGGIRDAGPDLIGGTGGIRDAGPDGIGGLYLTGGTTGRGGAVGTGGITGRGGAVGTGGIVGAGGATTGSTLCSGTPFSCSVNTVQSDCTYENGCVWTSSASICSGACANRSTQSSCTSDAGCVWNSSTLACSGTPSACCSGTPSVCSTYASGTWCIYNGCTWAGPLTCNATTMTSYCSSLITSSTTTCTACNYSSCCGQLTACMNDSTCWNTDSGPLYQAWMDCFVGCCATTC